MNNYRRTFSVIAIMAFIIGGSFAWLAYEIPQSAEAATNILFDAKSNGATGSGGAGAELLVSHTVGTGSDRLLVVSVTIRDKDRVVNYVKWGGTGGTNLTALTARVDGTNEVFVQLFYLINPASGTDDIAVQIDVNDSVEAIGSSWTGILQSSPMEAENGSTGSAASVSNSVTTTSDSLIIDGVFSDHRNAMTDGGFTTLFNTDRGNYQVGGQYRIEETGSTYALDWTFAASDTFAHGMAAFNSSVVPPSEPAGGTPNFFIKGKAFSNGQIYKK